MRQAGRLTSAYVQQATKGSAAWPNPPHVQKCCMVYAFVPGNASEPCPPLSSAGPAGSELMMQEAVCTHPCSIRGRQAGWLDDVAFLGCMGHGQPQPCSWHVTAVRNRAYLCGRHASTCRLAGGKQLCLWLGCTMAGVSECVCCIQLSCALCAPLVQAGAKRGRQVCHATCRVRS